MYQTKGEIGESVKVKVLVLGEAGVGKTTFTQSVKGRAVRNPSWTVGCSVDVITHSFKAGTPQETLCLVELWDVGGSRNHRNSRHVFYQQAHGIILVHDLVNRKSEENLRQWLIELFDDEPARGSSSSPVHRSASSQRLLLPLFDKGLLGGGELPMLIVGSKLDQAPSRGRSQMAADCRVDELTLDCRQPISPGSTNGLKLVRFFDRVVEQHLVPEHRKRVISLSNSDRHRKML